MATAKKTAATAEITLDDIIEFLASKVAEKIGDSTPTATKGKAKAAVEPDVEEDEDDVEADSDERREELTAMTIAALRKLAISMGFDKDDVQGEKDKSVLVDSILDAESEDEGSEDEEPEDEEEDDDVEEDEDETEEDDEEEEAEGYDRDELEALTLAKLKALAKENGASTADLKGLDKDDIIEWLLDDEEAEDEEDEEEAEDYSEMSLAELKALCKTRGIKIPRAADDETLIELLEEDDAE